MEFNTQVCTTMEQSKRLLVLGLKKETADMKLVPYTSEAISIDYNDGNFLEDDLYPAWSLHRLMAMLPDKIKMMSIAMEWWDFHLQIYKTTISYIGLRGVTAFNQNDNLYDNIIDCIEWLIKDGHFNKKHMNEK